MAFRAWFHILLTCSSSPFTWSPSLFKAKFDSQTMGFGVWFPQFLMVFVWVRFAGGRKKQTKKKDLGQARGSKNTLAIAQMKQEHGEERDWEKEKKQTYLLRQEQVQEQEQHVILPGACFRTGVKCFPWHTYIHTYTHTYIHTYWYNTTKDVCV